MADTTTAWFQDNFERLVTTISGVVRDCEDPVRRAVTCLVSGGHLLIEDVPGTGKTSLAQALAGAIDGTWRRIQFTPDLLPTDVTGTGVWSRRSETFEFHPGPVFANIVVADEINRASPKAQAALLEVMEERQVTVDGETYLVPEPFMVVATQNPVESAGTYPLPEAQLDRFAMRITLGHPSAEIEARLAISGGGRAALDAMVPVMSRALLAEMSAAAGAVHVADEVAQLVVRWAHSTRGVDGEAEGIRVGASTRAVIGLMQLARVWALAAGREYVIPEDVRDLVSHAWAHRLVMSSPARCEGRDPAEALDRLIGRVKVH